MNQSDRLMRDCLWLALCLLLFSGSVYAGSIYKWTDDEGRVHFSDRKPNNNQTSVIQPKSGSLSEVGRGNSSSAKDTSSNAAHKPKVSANDTSPNAVHDSKVVMFSTAWCPACKMARNYLRKKGVPFTDYDVEKDPAAAMRYRELGGHGVPLILVNGARMTGFNAQLFERLYATNW